MTVSIIICTRNHAESLSHTLASLDEVQIPQNWDVEILIVDNGSTDHTREVCESLRSTKAEVHYLYEGRVGQCHARNAGLRASRGEVILFTDDDVRVPQDWIVQMAGPILEGRADALAGGVIFPDLPEYELLQREPLSHRRSWFASSEALKPEAPSYMIGANMAFHRKVLESVDSFDTHLGPGALGFFDEVLFSWRLKKHGFRLSSALETKVVHFFDAERLTRESLMRIAKCMGASRAYVDYHWFGRDAKFCGLRTALFELRGRLLRAWKRLAGAGGQLPSIAELDLAQWAAFHAEFEKQRRIPRRYAGAATTSQS